MSRNYLDPHTLCGHRSGLTGCIWCFLWPTRPCRGMRNTGDATCFCGYVCIDSIFGDFARIITLWYHSIYRYQHWRMTHILIIYSPADQARRELSLAAWVVPRLLLRCFANHNTHQAVDELAQLYIEKPFTTQWFYMISDYQFHRISILCKKRARSYWHGR